VEANKIRGMTAPRPATFVFRAGIACLRGEFKYVEERRKEYEKRRNYFVKAVDELGWPCHMFEGAFYAWFDIRSTGMGSTEFLEKLDESQNIRLSPGNRFGADGFIRVPLVKPVPVLREAAKRLKAFKAGL